MRKLIAILLLMSSTSAFAEVCIGEIPDTVGDEVVPALCAASMATTEEGTCRIQGLYLDAGNGILIGVKPRFKQEVCEAFGFNAYVKGSAVTARVETFVNRQGQLVPGVHRVLSSVDCE